MSTTDKLLRNYRDFLIRVESICREIETQYAGHLACRAGCDGCCRQITLFPVEAATLAAALDNLPPDDADRIRSLARTTSPDDPCPLLESGLCLLYTARPIICRTHGLPILTEQEGKRSVDFCPLNFRDLSSLPGTAIIDLDRLNTTLAAINSLFIAELYADALPEHKRISISEALIARL